MHELAQETFRANLNGPAGEAARAYLAKRGVSRETIEQFGLGYSDRSGRVAAAAARAAELPGGADGGVGAGGQARGRQPVRPVPQPADVPDPRRRRARSSGTAARALAAEDNPKYLNSPETPIYKKSYVLYNLHRAKEAMRKEDRAILVEGYMDAIGVTAAGFGPVVASCGTALTDEQVRLIKRHYAADRGEFRSGRGGRERGGALDRTCCSTRACRCASWSSMAISIRTSTARSGAPRHTQSGWRARRGTSTGWPTARERSTMCARRRGKSRCSNFSCRRCSASPTSMERMVIAGDVAGYIGVDRGHGARQFQEGGVGAAARQAFQRPAGRAAARRAHAAQRAADESGAARRQIGSRAAVAGDASTTLPSRRIFQAIFALSRRAAAALDFEEMQRAAGRGRPEPAGARGAGRRRRGVATRSVAAAMGSMRRSEGEHRRGD